MDQKPLLTEGIYKAKDVIAKYFGLECSEGSLNFGYMPVTGFVIIDRPGIKFWVGGGKWSREYPDAKLFDTLRAARQAASWIQEKYGYRAFIGKDYGLETQEVME